MIGLVRVSSRAVIRRWRRNMLTVLATIVAAGALVALISIAHSSAQNLAADLDELRSNVVMATLPASSWSTPDVVLEKRASGIPGVVVSGTLNLPASGTAAVAVSRGDLRSGSGVGAHATTAVATRAGLDARGARILSGGIPVEAVQRKDPRQVLVGVALARKLGVSAEHGADRILIDGTPVTVAGIVSDNDAETALDSALVLTPHAARVLDLVPSTRLLIARTATGNATVVAKEFAASVFPLEADQVAIGLAPDPAQLRARLLTGSSTLVLLVTVVTVVATLFGIVTTMQIAVWERRREIAIGRALGASRGHVGLGFLVESSLLGGFGSCLGWISGVVAAALVCRLCDWGFVLPPVTLLVPLLGMAVGALAGAIPAWNATKHDPAVLLRAS